MRTSPSTLTLNLNPSPNPELIPWKTQKHTHTHTHTHWWYPLCLAGDFLKTLQDQDINVRRVALVMFNSAAHNKPSLIRGLLATVLPHLYKETQIRKDLIREVGWLVGKLKTFIWMFFKALCWCIILHVYCRWRWVHSNTRWMTVWTCVKQRSSVCTLCWTAAWRGWMSCSS